MKRLWKVPVNESGKWFLYQFQLESNSQIIAVRTAARFARIEADGFRGRGTRDLNLNYRVIKGKRE